MTLPNANRPPGQPRISWHGNGLLWAGLRPDGVYAVQQDQVEADGSIFNKLLWATPPPESRPTISGERLDAPAPPLRVIAVNQGSFSSAQKPSYMSAVSFPTAGCWEAEGADSRCQSHVRRRGRRRTAVEPLGNARAATNRCNTRGMTIELLYWDGCPSHPEALELLQAVLGEHGVETTVELHEVGTK